MKSDLGKLEKVESVSTIIVNIGTIISWIFSVITFFVLASQPEPVTIPGLLELSTSYKILFIISILFGYIQLLRRSWENHRKSGNETEGNFSNYLYGSVIKFKRPLVVLGFVFILGTLFIILLDANAWVTAIACCLVGLFGGGGVFAIVSESPYILKRISRRYDYEIRRKWLLRVRNQLHKDGYAHTGNFANLSDDLIEINWAIKMYFDVNEFEQDLVFSQQTIEKDSSVFEVCEIRFKHVASHLPKNDS